MKLTLSMPVNRVTGILNRRISQKRKDKMTNKRPRADGVLKNPKLSHIAFCCASHTLVPDKGYSIPDFIRLNFFEIKVEVKF